MKLTASVLGILFIAGHVSAQCSYGSHGEATAQSEYIPLPTAEVEQAPATDVLPILPIEEVETQETAES